MANGRKGKASKRKLDMREESGKLARQIGDRIQELREGIKDGDGRPITQPAFYDFIFDKPEYQQSTDNPNEPKPEESKQTEISNIEGGKDINLSLLCLISDKCGVSLDYLIRGKDYQPSAPTCPLEGKDASPAGDNPQPEKEPSAEMGSADLPPEEKAENNPYSDYLSCSPYDICKALAALTFIADLDITSLDKTEGRLGKRGVRIDIRPKEIILPVIQRENKLSLLDSFSEYYTVPDNLESYDNLHAYFVGLCNDPFKYVGISEINIDNVPINAYALHYIDKRTSKIFKFLEHLADVTEENHFDPFYYKLIDTWFAPKSSINLALNLGMNSNNLLNVDEMRQYDDMISTMLEPLKTFISRARSENEKSRLRELLTNKLLYRHNFNE